MNKERSLPRRIFDKVGYGSAFISLPFETIGAVGSIATGAWIPTLALGGLAFLDITQIREHGKSPEQQSWYNPERLWDRVWGRKRIHSSRMANFEKLRVQSNLLHFPSSQQAFDKTA